MRKRIHHLIKKYPIRSKILLGTFLIACMLILLECALVTFAFPKTTIGVLQIFGKTRAQTKYMLEKTLATPVKISIGNRIYESRYSDMGLHVDTSEILWQSYLPNISFFPKNAFLFLQSLFRSRKIPVELKETPDFDRFVGDLILEQTNGGDEIIFDPKEKEISYIERDTTKVVDRVRFLQLLQTSFGNTSPLTPELTTIPNPNKISIDTINKQLIQTYGIPLRIRVTAPSGETNRELSSDELKEIVTFTLTPGTNIPQFDCLSDTLFKYIPIPANAPVSPNTAKTAILDAIIARYHGTDVRDITIESGDGPNTAGEIAPQYAEIDISNQKLYAFREGTLEKTFRVSTGLYYPTPTGTFQIINKAPNAFSTIYNVWMPWWMAFGYSNELNAYFGLHELPYWLSDDGKKKQRPSEKIGTPSTGGCVALDIGEAEEFYHWSFVGMPVVIYQ